MEGSQRVLHAWQHVRDDTDTEYDRLVWHIDHTAQSTLDTLPRDVWHSRSNSPDRDITRQALITAGDATVSTSGGLSPKRRIVLGLFIPSHGRRVLTDYDARQLATERLVLWVLHQQRGRDLIDALHQALVEHAADFPEHEALGGWNVHWVISEQFLHAVDMVLAAYSTERMIDSFIWSQYLMMQDLLEHCANPATIDGHYRSAGLVM